MKTLSLFFLSLIFIGCEQKVNNKVEEVKYAPIKSQLIIDSPINVANDSIPDSIYIKIHKIIDHTEEYVSLKKQFEDKLELLVFSDKKQNTFEVNIGHIIFDRFSTSIRWNINVKTSEITMLDPHKEYEEVTLTEFRRRWKKFGYNSYH